MMIVQIYKSGAWITFRYPQSSPPTLLHEIERDLPFTFLASVGSITVKVEGTGYGRTGADPLAAGDSIRIIEDGSALFAGYIDETINWEERDGEASFDVIGNLARLKNALAGRKNTLDHNLWRWTKILDSQYPEGMSSEDYIDAVNAKGANGIREREIVFTDTAYLAQKIDGNIRWDRIAGLQKEHIFDSRRSGGGYFPVEEADQHYRSYYDYIDQVQIPGAFWRYTETPNINTVPLSKAIDDLLNQLFILGVEVKSLVYQPDYLSITQEVKLVDEVFSKVGYSERADIDGDARLYLATVAQQNPKIMPFVAEVTDFRLYEIRNHYDAVRIGENADIGFTKSPMNLVNDAYDNGGIPRWSPASTFKAERYNVGIVRPASEGGVGIKRILWYQIYQSIEAGEKGGKYHWGRHTAVEYVIYDLEQDFLVDRRSGVEHKYGWVASEDLFVAPWEFGFDKSDFVTGNFELWYNPKFERTAWKLVMTSDWRSGEMNNVTTESGFYYHSTNGIPVVTGGNSLTDAVFDYRNTSIFDVLTDFAKLTNSVFWMDGESNLYFVGRDWAGGTSRVVQNIIKIDRSITDKALYDPPEISSSLVDNKFFTEALSEYYSSDVYPATYLEIELTLLNDASNRAIRLGDRITWKNENVRFPYTVDRISIDRDEIVVHCWRKQTLRGVNVLG